MNIINYDTCTFCSQEPETIKHLFFTCDITKTFWSKLTEIINEKCPEVQVNWNITDVLFGNSKLDTVQNLILLQAKLYVYAQRCNKKQPLINHFRHNIQYLYNTEKFRYWQNNRSELFQTIWDQYKNIFSTGL